MVIKEHLRHVSALAKTQLYILKQYLSPENESWCYHTQFSYFLQIRELSLPLFHKAVRSVLGRHPVLKTVIVVNGQEMCQAINSDLNFDIHYEDITGLSESQQSERVKAYELKDRQELFNIYDTTQALFRTAIFKRDVDKIQFVLSFNHCIWDGWSLAILLKEIFAHYQVLIMRPTLTLSEANYDYKEFLFSEEKIRHSVAARDFWISHLKDHQPFWPKRIRESLAYHEYTPVTRLLSNELIDRLASLQQQLRVTMKAIFLGLFARTVQDETKLNSTTINIVTNGRNVELQNPLGTLGLLWNFAPVCIEHQIDDIEYLRVVGKSLSSIAPYGSYPLSDILKEHDAEQLSHAAFNYINFEGANLLDENSDVQFLEVGGIDKFHFPLHLLVGKNPFNKHISLVMNFDSRYYNRREIEVKLDRYIGRLETIADQHLIPGKV
jgi:hypothetical protein